MDELLLFTFTSHSLHTGQMGSCLQILLTSSPLNPDGRALTIYVDEPFTALQTDGLLPTIHIDEPFTAYQTDGLLPTIHIDEPLLHFKQTGSFLQFLLTSSPVNLDGRAPTIYIDEPFTSYQTDGLLPIIHKHELFQTALPDELFQTTLPDELLLFT